MKKPEDILTDLLYFYREDIKDSDMSYDCVTKLNDWIDDLNTTDNTYSFQQKIEYAFKYNYLRVHFENIQSVLNRLFPELYFLIEFGDIWVSCYMIYKEQRVDEIMTVPNLYEFHFNLDGMLYEYLSINKMKLNHKERKELVDLIDIDGKVKEYFIFYDNLDIISKMK